MPATLETIKTEKAAIIKAQREMLDRVEREKRSFTEEEEQRYHEWEADWNDLDAEQRYLEKNPKVNELLSSSRGLKAGKPYVIGQRHLKTEEIAAMRAVYQKKGIKMENRMENHETEFRYDPNERDGVRHSFNRYLLHGDRALDSAEFRALQGDLDTMGGYMVMPESVSQDFIRAKQNLVVLRQLGKQILLENAASLGVPSLDSEIADPTWTAEIRTGTEDSSMAFGKRDLNPHPLAKRIKVSETLLRTAAAAESVVRDSMAYKFGITEENALLNGSGQNQPLGLFTASNNGIDTSRDFTTSTTATVKADDLIDVVGNQKAQYRNGASAGWIMSRSLETLVRKLKDGEGNYIWLNSIRLGAPNTLLGYPVYVSEYAPSTFTIGKYVAIFGDFSYYWICDNLRMRIQRLTELYAETNQIGFIGRQETDGMPVLAEAFTRLKLK